MRLSALLATALFSLSGMWLASASAQAVRVSCEGHRATIVGTSGDDVLVGTWHRDFIVAGDGNDVVRGRGGNDRICGGTGADQLWGGPGNDRIFGGLDGIVTDPQDGYTQKVGDSLRGGTGRDRLIAGLDRRPVNAVQRPDQILWDTSPRAVRINMAKGVATGTGPDSFGAVNTMVVGSRYSDTIDGSSRADRIQAGPGSDVLRGHAGNDDILAEPFESTVRGNDRVWGGPGEDTLYSGFGRDSLYGGRGNDLLSDSASASALAYGGAGDDTMYDELSGGAQPRGFFGGTGVDELWLGTNHLPTVSGAHGYWNMRTGRLVLNPGEPNAYTFAEFERVWFQSGNEVQWRISGTQDDNFVNAGATQGVHFTALGGNDSFAGSNFDDVFNGGAGNDSVFGMGGGTDTCILVETPSDCETVRP